MSPPQASSAEPMRALALVEHVDRELDLMCLLKLRLKRRHGIRLRLANFYADAPLTLADPAPRAVLIPFFYAAEDVVLRDYVQAWPDTRFVNMAWEQIFYPSHASLKAPRDAFTREKVTHLAWSRDFVDYLAGHGTSPERLKLVGNSLYQLYRPPFSAYFAGRAELAEAFGLDPAKRWVFVPENYRWAFFTDRKLEKLSKRGVEHADLLRMRDYCRNSLAALMGWCDALARRGEAEVIFRPRPATSVEEISGFMRKVLGEAEPAFRLIKDRSARDWVLASDVVASSYSTVLIEAAVAGKALVKVDPEPVPASLRYDWCDLVPGAADEAAFVSACLQNGPGEGSAALRAWAERSFLLDKDPLDRLADAVAGEVRLAYARAEAPRTLEHGMMISPQAAAAARSLEPEARHRYFEAHAKGYFFTLGTHEKDLFDTADVQARVARWAAVLSQDSGGPKPRPVTAGAQAPGGDRRSAQRGRLGAAEPGRHSVSLFEGRGGDYSGDTASGSIRQVLKFVSLKHRFIYVAIGKAATQSVLAALNHIYKYEPEAFFVTRDGPETLYADPRFRDFLRFSLVRHPFTRAVSCYIDKIIDLNERKQRMLAKHGMDHPPESFDGFVDFLCSPQGQDDTANDHWASQFACLADARGEMAVHAVGRVENLDEDLDHMLSLAGTTRRVRMAPKNTRDLHLAGKAAKPDDGDYWSEEAESKLMRRYARDYETFDYLPFDVAESPSPTADVGA